MEILFLLALGLGALVTYVMFKGVKDVALQGKREPLERERMEIRYDEEFDGSPVVVFVINWRKHSYTKEEDVIKAAAKRDYLHQSTKNQGFDALMSFQKVNSSRAEPA